MICKYNNGLINGKIHSLPEDEIFVAKIKELKADCIQKIKELKPTLSYKSALRIIDECNTYIDVNKPWELAKQDDGSQRISAILYYATQAMLEAYTLLDAFLPEKIASVLKLFGIEKVKIDENACCNFKIDGIKVEKIQPLFARLDLNKEQQELDEIANKE